MGAFDISKQRKENKSPIIYWNPLKQHCAGEGGGRVGGEGWGFQRITKGVLGRGSSYGQINHRRTKPNGGENLI